MAGQLTFLGLYAYFSDSIIEDYTTIPQGVGNTCKLFVLPNIQIANIYLPGQGAAIR